MLCFRDVMTSVISSAAWYAVGRPKTSFDGSYSKYNPYIATVGLMMINVFLCQGSKILTACNNNSIERGKEALLSCVCYASLLAYGRIYNDCQRFGAPEKSLIEQTGQVVLDTLIPFCFLPLAARFVYDKASKMNNTFLSSMSIDKRNEYYLAHSSAKFPYAAFVKDGSFKTVIVNGVAEERLFIREEQVNFTRASNMVNLLKMQHAKRDAAEAVLQ